MDMPVMMKASEVAEQMGTNHATVLEYAARKDDPLPLRYIRGNARGGFVRVPELMDWIERNTCLYNERHEFREK